jgi:hypothetical protein
MNLSDWFPALPFGLTVVATVVAAVFGLRALKWHRQLVVLRKSERSFRDL